MEVDGEMARLQLQIEKVEIDIDKVEIDIEKVENAIQGGDLTPEDKQYWREKENKLREEKNKLREEQNKLLDLKLLYLKSKNGNASEDSKTLIMMKKCMEAVTRVEKGVYVSLWSTFWGEISTSTRTDNTDVFRKALVEYYGDEDDKLNVDDPDKALRCMVTGLRIPGEWITAAHLFPKKDKAKAHLIGIKDIDDPRNGMLWNRAIEEAFSLYQIVLCWDAEKNTYVLHIIDKNIFHEGLLMRKI